MYVSTLTSQYASISNAFFPVSSKVTVDYGHNHSIHNICHNCIYVLCNRVRMNNNWKCFLLATTNAIHGASYRVTLLCCRRPIGRYDAADTIDKVPAASCHPEIFDRHKIFTINPLTIYSNLTRSRKGNTVNVFLNMIQQCRGPKTRNK